MSDNLTIVRTHLPADKLRDRANADLWAIIMTLTEEVAALKGVAASDVTPLYARAVAANINAERKEPSDFPDELIAEAVGVLEVTQWSTALSYIARNSVIAHKGDTLICLKAHVPKEDIEPGTEGGRSYFRPLRTAAGDDKSEASTFAGVSMCPLARCAKTWSTAHSTRPSTPRA